MKLADKEYYEIMDMFEKEFHGRKDREKDKNLWKLGHVYEHGEYNNLFKAYLKGYVLGKAVGEGI